MADDIDKVFGDFESGKEAHPAIDSAFDQFTTPQSAAEAAAERTRKSVKRTESSTLGNAVKGFGSGIADVGLSGLNAINLVAGTQEEKQQYADYLASRNKGIEENAGPGSDIGRVVGQVVATAPLVPARALQAINVGMDAARAGAPILNRLGAAVNKGALSGGIFGGATSAANDKGVGENVLQGATTGAVAGPFAEAAASGGASLANKVKTGLLTSSASRAGGLNPGAVKATLQSLEEIGLTPTQAQAEIARLGPKATLADIDPALLDEAEMLAKSGGGASSMMKGRFAARADIANNEAVNIMNRNLGGNPDLDVLKDRIVDNAQKAVKADYASAHANTIALDVKPVIDDINQKLVNAVGSKASALREVKGYFYKDAKDAAGNPIKVLKNDVAGLHEIRESLDAKLQDKNPLTSHDKKTLSALNDVRAGVDEQLKTIPEMKAADEKFAERMDVLKGVAIGQNIFDRKTNYAQFAKDFNAASAEKQNIIREGIKGKVYDAMDQATRGELSEAQKLFGKASANRAKFKLAFGANADEVLDALEKEATFRGSERAVAGGSRTAQIQALQQKYGLREKGPGIMGDVLSGAVHDLAHGSGIIYTAVAGVKRFGHGIVNRLYNTDKTITGAADLFSRSGSQLDNAINTLDRVHSVRSRIQSRTSRPSRLPTATTAISEYLKSKADTN